MTSGLSVAYLMAQADGGGPPTLIALWPILVILVLWVLLIQRPQKREQATRQQMLQNLKKNDRVLTTSGIIGVVTNIAPDAREVTVRVDETNNTRLRMALSSIARVLADNENAEKTDGA